MDQKIEITWGSLWRILIMFIVVSMLFMMRQVLVILFLAIVISSALDAPLNWLERRKVPRILGILFILLIGLSAMVLLLYTVVPIAFIELKDFADNMDKVGTVLGNVIGVPNLSDTISGGLSNLGGMLVPSQASVASLLPKIFENLIMGIMVMVISIYLAWYRDGIEGFLRAVLPLQYEQYSISVLHRARKKIGKWLEGQLIVTAIVAVVVFIGLKLLGVNYALVIALLAGVLEIIPFVGPIIAGALAFLIGVSQSTAIGIAAVVLFFVIHQLEAHIMMPLVMRKTTGIHPVIVALAIVAGYQLDGFVGVILAIPFVVVIQELIDDFTVRKHRQPEL
jgi:predicted PurR-regulated permease PerM